jgi:hypothetical protein
MVLAYKHRSVMSVLQYPFYGMTRPAGTIIITRQIWAAADSPIFRPRPSQKLATLRIRHRLKRTKSTATHVALLPNQPTLISPTAAQFLRLYLIHTAKKEDTTPWPPFAQQPAPSPP